jgi:hypothetical protein
MRLGRKLFTGSAFVPRSICLGAILSLVGCGGDGKIARYPVTGTVLVDSKPAEGVMLIFCPVDGLPEFTRERPFATTDSAGRFELRTFQPGDGAPAGKYTVMARLLVAGSQRAPDERGGGAADHLKGRYFDPTRSGLTAEVTSGTNDLKFELSTKK